MRSVTFSAAALSDLAHSFCAAAGNAAPSATIRIVPAIFMARRLSGMSTGLFQALANGAGDPGAIEATIGEQLLRIAVLDELVRQAKHEQGNRDAASGQRLDHGRARSTGN